VREYAIISPRFWNGPTGRRLRAAGPEVRLLALYLFSAPTSNMLCLYYLPFPTICHEVDLQPAQAEHALRVLDAIGFAKYDFEAGIAWVIEGARYQIGRTLKPADKRIRGISRLLDQFRGHPYAGAFHRRYRAAYALPDMPPRSPTQAPSIPLRSQEQEQEQEQNERPPQPPPSGEGGAAAVSRGNGRPRPRRGSRAAQRAEVVEAMIRGGMKTESEK
jgi:hypothetical protein